MAKVLGSTFIVAGTAIGAAMLGLPLASAAAGFSWGIGLLLAMWALSYAMALIIMEVTLCFDSPASFSTMALATLGRPGQIIMNVSFAGLLYTLSVAYIVGGASLLDGLFQSIAQHVSFVPHLSTATSEIVFGGVLALFVYSSTQAVDYFNRLLFISKIVIFILVIAGVLQQLHPSYFSVPLTNFKYLYAAVPVFFTSYGYHVIIPSIAHYLDNDRKKLQRVLFWGSVLPLLMYFAWMGISFGLLPREGTPSFANILQQGNGQNVGLFISMLSDLTGRPWLGAGLNAVSDFAITTSFLGVLLGLFDFISDACHTPNNHKGRAIAIIITLIPPLVVALYYPRFLSLLGYAGLFFTVSGLIIPVLMFFRVRSGNYQSPYRLRAGYWVATAVLLVGIAIIALQCMEVLDLLPKTFH